MRLEIGFSLLLGIGVIASDVGVAMAASKKAEILSEAALEQKRIHELSVAACESIWDQGTHMTRREWSRTCRRVQNRLQSLDVR